MNDNVLKKEFSQKDVQRARNLVTGNTNARTTEGIGYSKKHEHRVEGDVWEENGRTWTIKNGLKQNITKLDNAKKAIRVPLTCPKCGGSMKHHLAQKMYKIHGFCFDVENLYLAKKENYLIKEIPIHWANAEGSKVRMGKDSLKMFFDLLRIKFSK